MIVEARAPTRVDLAGSTIDIWPLYVFHEGALTINIAVDHSARVRIEERSDGRIDIRSVDRGVSGQWERITEMQTVAGLELPVTIVDHFRPGRGMSIEMESTVPAGAGMAGSSSLNIALCGAVNRLTGDRYSLQELALLAKNLEARVIKVPTGEQDYVPALFGGVHVLHLDVDGVRAEKLDLASGPFEARLVICYSGKPRQSGINNWELIKRHIDGDPMVIDAFDRIRDDARSMRDALVAGDMDAVGTIMAEEWEDRTSCFAGITTPFLERLRKAALKKEALGGRICGAGGGGCVLFVAREGRRKALENVLREEGAEILEFHVAEAGLTVE